jgi:hypothetical protein
MNLDRLTWPAIGALLVAAGSVPLSAQVVSDPEWRASAHGTNGWSSVEFEDSRWPRVGRAHPNAWSGGSPIPWPADSSAVAIWSGDDEPEAFLRRTFEVREDTPHPALAFIQVDDDYEFYFNGDLVARNDDGVLSAPGEVYDVTRRLRKGRNVVAIHAVDRGFGEHVLFALHFGGNQPLPSPPVAAQPRSRENATLDPAAPSPSRSRGAAGLLILILLAVSGRWRRLWEGL